VAEIRGSWLGWVLRIIFEIENETEASQVGDKKKLETQNQYGILRIGIYSKMR